MLKALENMKEVNASFPYSEPIRKWKKEGGKVVGWSCIYVPEELTIAAGMLPVRVTGGNFQPVLENANAYIYTSTCSYMRTCFELVYTGQFEFLDGIAIAYACRGMRILSELWDRHMKIPLIYNIDVPRQRGDMSWLPYYQLELEEFQRRLEAFSGAQITPASLKEAIKLCNRTRQLLHQIYQRRKADNPPISGAETLEVVNAATRMPKEEFNQLAEELLAELGERELPANVRLMLCGSILNNPAFVRGLEEASKGLVVIDELCTGARYWWNEVEESSNPLAALATRYFNNYFPCACMEPPQMRVNQIVELAKEYRIDGVVVELMRNCFPYIQDEPVLLSALRNAAIPVLELDVEYGDGWSGQLRTRMEAFAEMLEARKEPV